MQRSRVMVVLSEQGTFMIMVVDAPRRGLYAHVMSGL